MATAGAACGSAGPTTSAPTQNGNGASTPTPAQSTQSSAGGTADITFSGDLTGTLNQPTRVSCQATPFNVYIGIVGPVGGSSYDLELEAYGYTGPGTFTVGGTPAAGGQLGPAEQHTTLGSTSGTLTLSSKSAGMVSMTLTPSAGGGQTVMVAGTWSCASVV